jgi:hypothetical protein
VAAEQQEQQGQQEQQAASKPSGRVKSEAHKARDAAEAKAAMAASHKLKVDKGKSSSDDKASKAKGHTKPN